MDDVTDRGWLVDRWMGGWIDTRMEDRRIIENRWVDGWIDGWIPQMREARCALPEHRQGLSYTFSSSSLLPT